MKSVRDFNASHSLYYLVIFYLHLIYVQRRNSLWCLLVLYNPLFFLLNCIITFQQENIQLLVYFFMFPNGCIQIKIRTIHWDIWLVKYLLIKHTSHCNSFLLYFSLIVEAAMMKVKMCFKHPSSINLVQSL